MRTSKVCMQCTDFSSQYSKQSTINLIMSTNSRIMSLYMAKSWTNKKRLMNLIFNKLPGLKIRPVAPHQTCGTTSDPWHHIRPVAPHQTCCTTSDLWHHIRPVAPHQICGTTSDLWHHIRPVTPHQTCGTTSDLWHHIRPVAPHQTCGTTSDLCLASHEVCGTFNSTLTFHALGIEEKIKFGEGLEKWEKGSGRGTRRKKCWVIYNIVGRVDTTTKDCLQNTCLEYLCLTLTKMTNSLKINKNSESSFSKFIFSDLYRSCIISSLS